MAQKNKDIGETSEKHRRNIGEASEKYQITGLNDTQQKIVKLLSEDNRLSAAGLADKIGVAARNIENNIKKLKDYGILVRHGSPRNGCWEVAECEIKYNQDEE